MQIWDEGSHAYLLVQEGEVSFCRENVMGRLRRPILVWNGRKSPRGAMIQDRRSWRSIDRWTLIDGSSELFHCKGEKITPV